MPTRDRRVPRVDTRPTARDVTRRHRDRASVAEERRRRGMLARRVAEDRPPRPRGIFDRSPHTLVWLAGGAILGTIIPLAIASRIVGGPLIILLMPIVGGDRVRGFGVGFGSGLAPVAVIWWLFLGQRRGGSAWKCKALLGVPLLLLALIPFLVLVPPVRAVARGPSAQSRAVARDLPGAGAGASAVFFGAGSFFGGRYLLVTANRQRQR
jgi:hypothetical protein